MKLILRQFYPLWIIFSVLVCSSIATAQVTIDGSVTNYTTIQSAVNAASDGDVILISDQTYTENLNVNVGVTLQLAPGAVNATLVGSITISSDDVIIDGLTITNPSGKRAIYAVDRSNLIFRNLVITDIGSSDATTSGTNYGIAIVSASANVDNILIENNALSYLSGGAGKKSVNGIAIGWSTGIYNILNVTIRNNSLTNFSPSTGTPWGMYGIIINHASGAGAHTGQTTNLNVLNNIVSDLSGEWVHGIGLEGQTPSAIVQGNSISNLTSGKPYDNYAVFFESNSYISTVKVNGNNFNSTRGIGIHSNLLSILSTEILDASNNWWGNASGPSGTDLSGTGSILGDDVSDASLVAHLDYSPWLGDAVGTIPMTRYTNDKIQDAINASSDNDIIYVLAGLYEEAILINKPLSLFGATYNIVKENSYLVPAGYSWDTSVESVIMDPASNVDGITVDITNTSNVTFKGFVVQSLNTQTGNRHLLRVYATSSNMDNIIVTNNIIGPNTQIGDESNYGRMGLYIVPHYGHYAITNSIFSHNKIFNSGGNGNNIFVWGSYSTSSDPIADLTNTVIEYNDIYGSRRSGIEVAGGVKNLIIRNNKIHDNGFNGDEATGSDYKYGNGITLIRMGSEKTLPTASVIDNLTIQDNRIYNNKKFGIYMGPMNTNHTISGNEIYGNSWDGIQIDLVETYHGGLNPAYDIAFGITPGGNDIYNNGKGINIVGTPTNNFTLEALENWWGNASGPYHATTNITGTGNEVSDFVNYNPWLGNSSEIPHDNDNNWTYYVSDENPAALQDIMNQVNDGDTIVVVGNTTSFPALVITKSVILKSLNGAVIDHGSPAITVAADDVTIIGFTFNFAGTDYAIQVSDGYSNVSVHFCNFLTQNAIDNQSTSSEIVNATYNWWGNISGPTHSTNAGGTGSLISDNVMYSPLTSPLANATGVSLEPEFSWLAVDADSYNLQIATDAEFTSLVQNITGLTTNSFNMRNVAAALDANTNYFWRVSAENEYAVNTWSTAREFSTVSEITMDLTAPVQGLEINAPVINLYWLAYSSLPNLTYDVFYSTTLRSTYQGDEAASLRITGLSNMNASVTNLLPGQTYYWQVRVKTSDEAIAGYSAVDSFKTYNNLVKPTLIYPYNGAQTYNTSPYVYWLGYDYSMAIQYRVRYSTNPTVDAVNGELTTLYSQTEYSYNSYAQLLNLSEGATYYWQVAATNGISIIWSDVYEMVTPAAVPLVAPVPTYPTGGTVVYSSSTTFYWYSLNYGANLQYEIQYNDDGAETGGVLTGATALPLTSDYFKQISNLTGGETYFWQVRTYNGSSYSDWSEISSFSVYQSVEVAQQPILLAPYDGSLVNTINPTVYWTVYGVPSGYDFTIVYNSDGDQDMSGNLTDTRDVLGGATNVSTSGFHAQFVDNLTEGSTYYWQVVATKGTSTAFSQIRTFTVATSANNSVHIPIPTAPVNGLVLNGNSATLYWLVYGSYSHLEFEVLYSTDNTVVSGVLQNNVTSAAWTDDLFTTLENLTAGATYYWQVRSRLTVDPNTISDYSEVQNFSLYASSSPSMTILGSPIAGVELTTNNPVLSWVPPVGSSIRFSYELEISDNKDMTTAQVIKNLTSNSYKVNLPANKNYYWRVRTKSEDGNYSDYTGKGQFRVGAEITSVEQDNELPTEFSLSQNYPNPFNPDTKINFSLSEASPVTLKIYDILGREVITLINDNYNAGSYSVNWDAKNSNGIKVVSGTYIYRIVAGNKVDVKKMILLK